MLQFLINDQPIQLPHPNPQQTLLQFLRSSPQWCGSKEGCAEGDCGACTVLLCDLDARQQLRKRTINACIRLLPSLHGKAIYTVEWLQRQTNLHPVQQAMVDQHASQCGFCTPGFVMSLYGLWCETANPDHEATTHAISGNLCRCTGYRPIIDSAQHWKQHPQCAAIRQTEATHFAELHQRLSALTNTALEGEYPGIRWYCPRSIEAVSKLKAEHPEAVIVAGATDVGLWITKLRLSLPVLIFLNQVEGLETLEEKHNTLHIAAQVSLHDAFAALVKKIPELNEVCTRFASTPIRHSGTLIGNLANGSPIGDALPILIALAAEVTLLNSQGSQKLPLASLYLDYKKQNRSPQTWISHVHIPLPETGSVVRAYKVSKRIEQDISSVFAAFVMRKDAQNRITHFQSGLGGVAAIACPAKQLDAYLIGKVWNESTLAQAQTLLQQSFDPISDMRASSDYRRQILKNLLQRFYLETNTDTQTRVRQALNPQIPPLSSQPHAGTRQHIIQIAPTSDPHQRSEAHESAHLHVSGHATYTDDLIEAKNIAYAALGCSTQAHAKIKHMDLSKVQTSHGVMAVLTAKNITGKNNVGAIIADDPILADGLVQYVGQPIFIVVANDIECARKAATLAYIDYEPLQAYFSARQAHEAQQYVLPKRHLARANYQAALQASPHQLSASCELGGQDHFYLEGQIAIAEPRENATWNIYSSTQHPTEVQEHVAHALGIASHAVQVQCRRMGGGFGGKESQATLIACAAAIAAQHVNCPVKLRLDRDADMQITGKRHDFSISYHMGFDTQGKIQAAHFELLQRCGFSADLSGPVGDRAMFHCDNAYYLPAVDIHSWRCKTNTQSNTAFRGFGGPQGMFAIESAIDDIARTLHIDALEVRKRNLYGIDDNNVTPYGQTLTDNILAGIIETLAQSADYYKRRQALSAWNNQSPIVKRGLALTPVKFGISFTATFFNQAACLIHIYKDGSVQVTHGGTEMGQGLHSKIRNIVAAVLALPLTQVMVVATDTSKVANTSATAASAGCDLNGHAALIAANTLKQRLIEFAAEQKKVNINEVRWSTDGIHIGTHKQSFSELAHSAWFNRINLSANGFYRTPDIHYNQETMQGRPFFYFAYGACASEVEIDTLTGETHLRRVDILHDVGESINPAIDLGQIEGGFIQGYGWLTSEELKWDSQGVLKTHAPSTYKIPTAFDCPDEWHTTLMPQSRNRENVVRGSKAVGEPPLMLALSSFFAIRDAIASTQPQSNNRIMLDAPATPEAILRAITLHAQRA